MDLDRWLSIKPQDPDCDDSGYAIIVENFKVDSLTPSQIRRDRIQWCHTRTVETAQNWFRVLHADKLPGGRQSVGRAEVLA